jgi:hypothetical protein
MINSGCTGWRPNPASLAVAEHPLGPWKTIGDPCVEDTAGTTFDGQSTFVLPVQGRPGAFIYMGNRWNTDNMADSRHVWLPVVFGKNGLPELHWRQAWDLSVFDQFR